MKKLIFISHSSANAEIARELCEYLEEREKKCFIAPRDIRLGHEYAEEILGGIDNSYVMVLMLSKESNTSPHVLREVERAVSKNIPIIVYRIENVQLSKSLEYFLMTHQWMDAADDKDFKRIMDSIEGFKDNGNENQAAEKNDTAANEISNKQETTASNTAVDKRKKNTAAIVGGIVAVIAVIAIVVGVILSSGNKDNNTADNSTDKTAANNIDNDKPADETKATNQNNNMNSKIKLGETVALGTYNGEEILWSVLRINEDNTAVLVADKILTFKAVDGAESGASYEYDGNVYSPGSVDKENFELLVQTMGNNCWSQSNIRTWLNSDSKNVTYVDSMPIAKAMADRMNGYNTEPGFLNGFSDEEKNVIVEVENITKEYYSAESKEKFADGKDVITKDKVYLLAKSDLDDFKNAGISLYASPTDAAASKDETNYYEQFKNSYHVGEFYWWLREPVENTPHKCYFVTSGQEEEQLGQRAVNVESFGIRPAITVDVAALVELIGKGLVSK